MQVYIQNINSIVQISPHMILRHLVYPCGDTEVDLWALDTFGLGISAAEFPGMAFTDAGP